VVDIIIEYDSIDKIQPIVMDWFREISRIRENVRMIA
jgi:hypothetical protein